MNFGIANEFDGLCVLRFDDTNPETSTKEYCDSILEDVKWLTTTNDSLYSKTNSSFKFNYTSNYFDKLYEYCELLIKKKKAYVCSLPQDEFLRDCLGSTREFGMISPYFSSRDVQENLNLLNKMQNGEYEPGSHVIRARIDMNSKNMIMRDPILMRIRKETHFRGGARNIYPSYDFAHCISDVLEGTTHSLCTLEFTANNELYEWILDAIEIEKNNRVSQTEFARLNLTYTLTSKRVLRDLVKNGFVDGFDDPRLATLAGLRRRGVPSSAIVDFCNSIGVAKTQSFVDIDILEACIRRALDAEAKRVMCVLDPLKIVLTNVEASTQLELQNHQKRPELGTRIVHFSRDLYIERSDFEYEHNVSPKKFKRLTNAKNRSVRIRGAGMIRVLDVIEDEQGNVLELRCEHRNESGDDFPKPKAVIHWVCANTCRDVDLNLYERLFNCKDVGNAIAEGENMDKILNPSSRKRLSNCKIESEVIGEDEGTVQFERVGYFCYDKIDSSWNRTISLRSSAQ